MIIILIISLASVGLLGNPTMALIAAMILISITIDRWLILKLVDNIKEYEK